MPRPSIVVPASNGKSARAEMLDTILGQTFGDWDCVVVDDGAFGGRGTTKFTTHMHRDSCFKQASAREEPEARLCRGDLRDARREFLRVRHAYLSTAKFAFATPVIVASPQVYAAYLRRVRTRRAGSSAAGDHR